MKDKNINPNDVVSRALLLMKYDTKNTLSENETKIKPNISEQSNVSGNVGTVGGAATGVLGAGALGGAAAAAAAGTSVKAGALGAITSWGGLGTALANPVGLVAAGGVLAVTGAFLYGIYRNADNEEKLRDTYKACKVMKSKGYYDELNRNMALKQSEVKQAALLYYQSKKGEADIFGQGWGSNEAAMRKANAIMKKGNLADICVMMLKYQGEDFADEMAEEFDEFDLAELVDAFDNAVDEYAGGGFKVIPDDSYNINWYKENYPCVFRSRDVWVKQHGVQIDDDGYTYIVIKGLKRKDANGKDYQRFYRLYGDGSRITTVKTKTGQVKDTNATLKCQGPATPIAVVQGDEEGPMTESLYEKYLRKNKLNEIFDDRNIEIISGDILDDKMAGWDEGKKVAPWPVWLKKYPCLKLKHPTSTPLTDNMGYTYFINLNPKNNKKYRFYSDGEIWNEDGSKFIGKKWSCASRGDEVIVESRKNLMEQIPFDIEGETDVTSGTTGSTSGGTITPSTNWKKCLDFPYTEGCYNYKIGEVQSCLGIKPIDAKFGPITLKALKDKGYGEEISKEVYDKIMAACPAKPNNKKPDTNPDVNKSTNLGPNDLIATTEV